MTKECHVFRNQGRKEEVWVSPVPQDPVTLIHPQQPHVHVTQVQWPPGGPSRGQAVEEQ